MDILDEKAIGTRLREERNRHGLSQTALATIGGVQKNTQFHYEAGNRFPDARYLVLCDQSGLDVLYVLTGRREHNDVLDWLRDQKHPVLPPVSFSCEPAPLEPAPQARSTWLHRVARWLGAA